MASRSLFSPLALAVVGAAHCGLAAAGDVDFRRDIQPLLADRCYQCHGPDANHRKAGLQLDEEAAAKADAIVPGDPDASELLRRILSTDPNEQMPPPGGPKPALTSDEADLVRRWIAEGAPWKGHWAFEPPARAEPPAVAQADWSRDPMDAFVAARIEEAGLAPAPEAPRETLIRRASLDLTGLPPTPAEVDAFVNDAAPDAYERLVTRLLDSPHYGERMAVDWLDGARFADSNGYQNDFSREMWLWRDWVIDAFNRNLPYDRFAIEQLAGDLLPNASDAQRIATGFNRNNRSVTEGGAIEEEWRVENIVDRVETTATVFLGVTMGCARCHDHKYDPVSQREFFQFFSFFNSTEDRGFYEETRGNTGPLVHKPTFDQQMRLGEMDAGIAEARAALAAAEADTEGNFAAWRDGLRGAKRPAVGKTLALHAQLSGGLALANAADPAWTPGPVGSALALDGTPGAHVDLGQAFAPARDDTFTLMAWVRPDTAGAVVSKMDDADGHRGFDVLVTEKGEVAVHLVHAWPDDAILVVTNETTPLGGWTHVAVTYDGTAAPGGVKVYLAGRPTTLRAERKALTGSIQTTAPLRVGSRETGQHLRGAVADLRIYNRVFAEGRIDDIIEHSLGAGLPESPDDAHEALLREVFARRGDTVIRAARESLAARERDKANYLRDEVPSVMVMRELPEPRPAYLLARGAYDAPDLSEPLWPATPAFLPPMPEGAPSNRLGLALWITHPEHPLTARVAVNRLWKKFFGRGLVDTPDNFGVQSLPPSHPELLDLLALDFIADGWDLKALQRRIVLSAAYRQDSAATPDLIARDPENRLLARGPRVRLPAELIRDSALAASGLLVPEIGGPSVMPYQPEGLWDELAGGAGQGPYVQATGKDLYRRSLYTYRKRTVPHPTLTTFDAPSFELCTVQRGRTNTPLQALALLNDLTYVEAARALAERMLREGTAEDAARLRHGFRLVTGRMPTDREAEVLTTGLSGHRTTFAAAPEDAEAFINNGDSTPDPALDRIELAAYTAIAGVLLNLDETITKE